jgi:hypothetical protein
VSLDKSFSGERSDVSDEKLDVSVVHELEELSGVGVELFRSEDRVVETGRQEKMKLSPSFRKETRKT